MNETELVSRQAVKKESVLIAEDDAAVRRILSSVLSFEGLDVTTVTNGHEVLEAVRGEQSFEGIFLDLSLPGPHGGELIQEIVRSVDIPIFVMTGAPSPDKILGEAKADVREIFIKPFDPLEMIAALRRHRVGPDL